MATNFKIHVDEENSHLNGLVKPKEVKAVGKQRFALAQIQNNNANCSSKATTNYVGALRDAVKESQLVPKLKEGVQRLGLRDRSTSQKNPKASSQPPREEVKNVVEPVLSPMLVDGSPLGGAGRSGSHAEEKENCPGPSLRSEKTPLRNEKKITEKVKTDDDLVVASPMSIDTSPAQLHEKDSLKSDLEDLYSCNPYKHDIYKYLRKIEEEFRPKAGYMRRQPDVSYTMRAILVDWLVEVGEEYKLKNETLFMAVSYIDRFLSTMAVAKPKLQLLGTSAMFIAAKFEEIYPPEAGEFTYITDDSYTIKQVLRMERLILKVLRFDLSCPTAFTFLMHISACVKLPSKVINLAMYLCELTLLEADPYLDFLPSLIACGALVVARHSLDYADLWPSCLAQTAGYSFLQLSPVVNHLSGTHQKSFTISQAAARQKYSAPEYEGVSTIPYKNLVLRDSSTIN